jgi:hypothetical protein
VVGSLCKERSVVSRRPAEEMEATGRSLDNWYGNSEREGCSNRSLP